MWTCPDARAPPPVATCVQVQSHGSAGVDLEFRWKTGTHATLLGSFTGWEEEIMHFEFDTQVSSCCRSMVYGVWQGGGCSGRQP